MRAILRVCWGTFSALAIASEVSATDPQGIKVVGYYGAWDTDARAYPARRINAALFTHLVYAFAKTADDELGLADAVADPRNFEDLQAMRQRNQKLQLLIGVGGWLGSAELSNIASTDERRRRFAASAVVFIRSHHFDGIDLDWEYPVEGGEPANSRRAEDRDNLPLLLRSMRQALDAAGAADGRRYLLSIAVGASEAHRRNLDSAAILPQVDWVGLMSYDFSGAWSATSGHNAPLLRSQAPSEAGPDDSVGAAVARYLAAGFPGSKLLLGLPLYGRSWRGCNASNDGEYRPCKGPAEGTWEPGVLDYWDIAQNYVPDPAFAKRLSASAGTPFLFDASTGRFISYDDETSFRRKLAFLKENALGGAMLWEVSADPEASLISVVAKELLRR